MSSKLADELKGNRVTRFFASGFFHESVFPQSQSITIRPFRIFSKVRGDIQGAPPVSTTPAANFSTSFASVVDTVETLPLVSTIPLANLPTVSRRRWQLATAINDTGGKFATGVNNNGSNYQTAGN
jgi:hypothetical protein